METLKIAFVDFWPEWNIEDFISPILRQYYDIKIDRNNPDVIFHSIFNRMSETPKYKCKKILILAENWRPEQFGSDYSISFDPHSNKNFRLPLWQIYLLLWPELKEKLYNRKNYAESEFERWCAFIVSNPSNFMRNSAYSMLSQYKKVHSYGKYMNNDTSLQELSHEKYWRDIKYKFFVNHPHKFIMAYENSPYKYYCTEKLMDAFLVGSMPIYWGDPRVEEDWNPDAFLNVTKKDIDIIKNIDKNWKDFETVYKQPIFTDLQKQKLENNLSNFKDWLIQIIKQ